MSVQNAVTSNMYIADPEKLKEISKKWPKAGKVEHEET